MDKRRSPSFAERLQPSRVWQTPRHALRKDCEGAYESSENESSSPGGGGLGCSAGVLGGGRTCRAGSGLARRGRGSSTCSTARTRRSAAGRGSRGRGRARRGDRAVVLVDRGVELARGVRRALRGRGDRWGVRDRGNGPERLGRLLVGVCDPIRDVSSNWELVVTLARGEGAVDGGVIGRGVVGAANSAISSTAQQM